MPRTATDYGHADVYRHERVLHTYGVLLSSSSVRNNNKPIKLGFLFPREFTAYLGISIALAQQPINPIPTLAPFS